MLPNSHQTAASTFVTGAHLGYLSAAPGSGEVPKSTLDACIGRSREIFQDQEVDDVHEGRYAGSDAPQMYEAFTVDAFGRDCSPMHCHRRDLSAAMTQSLAGLLHIAPGKCGCQAHRERQACCRRVVGIGSTTDYRVR